MCHPPSAIYWSAPQKLVQPKWESLGRVSHGLVAGLLLDKQMLQDIAKKSGEPEVESIPRLYPIVSHCIPLYPIMIMEHSPIDLQWVSELFTRVHELCSISRRTKGTFLIVVTKCLIWGKPACLNRAGYQSNWVSPLRGARQLARHMETHARPNGGVGRPSPNEAGSGDPRRTKDRHLAPYGFTAHCSLVTRQSALPPASLATDHWLLTTILVPLATILPPLAAAGGRSSGFKHELPDCGKMFGRV